MLLDKERDRLLVIRKKLRELRDDVASQRNRLGTQVRETHQKDCLDAVLLNLARATIKLNEAIGRATE